MIKIKAGNARNSRAIAKPAFIFLGNAEVGYFRLKMIVYVLIRGSLSLGDYESPCLQRESILGEPLNPLIYNNY